MATILDIESEDGSVKRVKVLMADRIAVGNAGKGTAEAIGRNPMEYQARLAYAALARMGLVEGTYDEWLPTVSDMDIVEAAMDPTEMAIGATP